MRPYATLSNRPGSMDIIVCSAMVSGQLLNIDGRAFEKQLVDYSIELLDAASVKATGLLESQRGGGGDIISWLQIFQTIWMNMEPLLKHWHVFAALKFGYSLGRSMVWSRLNLDLKYKEPTIRLYFSINHSTKLTDEVADSIGIHLMNIEVLSQYVLRKVAERYPEFSITRNVHAGVSALNYYINVTGLGIENRYFEQLLRRTLLVQQPVKAMNVTIQKAKYFGLLKRTIRPDSTRKSRVYYTLFSTKIIKEI